MLDRKSFTQKTIEAYETHQDLFLQEWNSPRYKVPPHLKDFVCYLPKAGRLLDLGCGPAQDSRYLGRQGFHVCGVDLTWSFLQAARTCDPRLPLIHADMRYLPFHGQAFDGIWAAASLIHLPKPTLPRLFKVLFSLTKPGGFLGLTMMHGKGAGVFPLQWIPGRYLAKWLKPELDRVLWQAGWEVLSLKRVHSQERKGFWLNLLAKRPP